MTRSSAQAQQAHSNGRAPPFLAAIGARPAPSIERLFGHTGPMSARGRPVLAPPDELTPRSWLGALLGPSLPNASCSGQAPRWDSDQLPHESTQQMRERLHEARLVCRGCPVREPCTVMAADDPNAYGVRGDMTYGRPGRRRPQAA